MKAFAKAMPILLLSSALVTGLTSCSSDGGEDDASISETSTSTIHLSEGLVGGTLSIKGNIANVETNSSVTIIATPYVGYTLSNIVVNGQTVSYDANNSYTFVATSSDYYVDAHFSLSIGESSLTISGETMVSIGSSTQLNAKVYGAVGSVIWTSSNEYRATVSSSGLVTGVSAGAVTITATSAYDASVYDTFLLFVSPSYFTSMVSYHQGLDFSSGLSFEAEIGLLGSSLPITIDLIYDNSTGSRADTYESTSFHVNIDLTDLGSVIPTILKQFQALEMLFASMGLDWDATEILDNGTAIDLYCLTPGVLDVVVSGQSYLGMDDDTWEDIYGSYVIAYEEVNIGSFLGKTVFSFLPTILSLIDSSSEGGSSYNMDEILSFLDGVAVYGDGSETLDSVIASDGTVHDVGLTEDGYWGVDGTQTSFTKEGSANTSSSVVAVTLTNSTTSTDGSVVDTFTVLYSTGSKSTFTRTTASDGTVTYSSRFVSVSESGNWIINNSETNVSATQTVEKGVLAAIPLTYQDEHISTYELIYTDGETAHFTISNGNSIRLNSAMLYELNSMWTTSVLSAVPETFQSMLPETFLDLGLYFDFDESGNFSGLEFNVMVSYANGTADSFLSADLSSATALSENHFNNLYTELQSAIAVNQAYDDFRSRNEVVKSLYSLFDNDIEAISDKAYVAYLTNHWEQTYADLGSDLETLTSLYSSSNAPRPLTGITITDANGNEITPTWSTSGSRSGFTFDLEPSTTYNFTIDVYGFDEISENSSIFFSSTAGTVDKETGTFTTKDAENYPGTNSTSIRVSDIATGLDSAMSYLIFE